MNRPAFAATSTCGVLLIMETPRLEWPAVKHLSDVNVLEVSSCPPRDALLVHEAGHIGRDNVLSAMAQMIVYLVQPHARRYSFVGHAEGAPKATAVIRTVHRHQHHAFHFLE